MNSKLFIPDKIHVGFVNRSDTFEGKLSFVTYFDQKGILRKQASWDNWRDKMLEPITFDNTPIDGFVLNKKVGGYKSDWNYRSAAVRIWDSRGFEFEISVENLLFIMENYNFWSGKGIDGKLVYSWDKDKLVLLPVNSESYKQSVGFTSAQSGKVYSKDLILGATYCNKQGDSMVYLGRRPCYDVYSCPERWNRKKYKQGENLYVFYGERIYKYCGEPELGYIFKKDLTSLSSLVSSEVSENYSNLVEGFLNGKNGSPVVGLFLKDEGKYIDHWFVRHGNKYIEFSNLEGDNYGYVTKNHNLDKQYYHGSYNLVNDIINHIENSIYSRTVSYKPGTEQLGTRYYVSEYPWQEPSNCSLWAKMGSGVELQVGVDI